MRSSIFQTGPRGMGRRRAISTPRCLTSSTRTVGRFDIGIRFALDQSHALGFGFDDLRYERKDGYDWEQRQVTPQWLKFTTVHVDYYLYFQRRAKVSYYVAPFLGIEQQELRYKKNDVQTNEYRFLYGGNLGVEYFVTRSFSFDLSGKVFVLPGSSGTSVALQPALGFHVYVI